jgi:hypothetical protein
MLPSPSGAPTYPPLVPTGYSFFSPQVAGQQTFQYPPQAYFPVHYSNLYPPLAQDELEKKEDDGSEWGGAFSHGPQDGDRQGGGVVEHHH